MASDPFARLAPEPAAEWLDRIALFVRRYVVVSDAQRDVITLWIAHTHVRRAVPGDDSKTDLAFRRSPLLSITSVQEECGKTRLLEVSEPLVADPWFTERVSSAALVRKIAKDAPTLLLDESDTAFKANAEYAETLRGIINAGYRRGGVAHLCVPPRWDVVAFPVYCAKAIAGIGKLPDTAASRSIPIRLQRRAPGEQVEDFYEDEVAAPAKELHEWLRDFGTANADRLAAARPDVPAGLRDRSAEISMPLLAIADLAGGTWPERARAALVELLTGADAEVDNIGRRLLADAKYVFDRRREQKVESADRIKTADLINALCQIEESPWGDWRAGNSITAHGISKLLRPYGIKTMPVKVAGETVRGYKREQFEDAWLRYLTRAGVGVTGVISVTSPSAPQAEGNAGNAGNAWDRGQAAIPLLGDEEPPATAWECSCGASAGGRTLVSLREPLCLFCGRRRP